MLLPNEPVGYLVKDGTLLTVVDSVVDSDKAYKICNNPTTFQVYEEHLDGPLLDVEEAKELFPEEFI